jgi:4-hydroxybenzoate-CoA ligase
VALNATIGLCAMVRATTMLSGPASAAAPSLEDLLPRRPYNAATDFIDRNVDRGFGDKIAFTDSGRALSYAELQVDTCRFAAALHQLGLREESRIILLFQDTVDYPVAFWGAIRAGIVPIPVNTLLTADQYAYLFADSRAAAAVVAAPLAPTLLSIRDRLPYLRSIVVVGASADDKARLRDVLFFESVLREADARPFTAPTMSDEVAFWMYTSGSTGDPKAVKHVHTTLMASARLMGQGIVSIQPDDVTFSAAKLSFSYGLGNAMAFPMSVGASTALLPDRPTPDAVLGTLRRHRPTIFYAVPSLYAALLAHPAIGPGAGSDRLRLCISAGEALPADLARRWRAVVGVDILDGLGSTEMFQTFLSNRTGDLRYGSTGKPVPGYEVKIVDESGSELAAGEIGELVVRGPTAGEGYWNQRAKSRRTFVGEWTYTGDKYFRDQDGYYYCCGRTDDMFKVNGMWVSPFEVEAALTSHEAVLDAAVIGKQDRDGLIKPKAFIVLKSGYGADEQLLESLRFHVKERAGPWKYPRWIDVCPDLPRTATGKLQRFKLRE